MLEGIHNNIFSTSSPLEFLGNFFDVNSTLIPAYAFKLGAVADIENMETSKITTIVEYKKIRETVAHTVAVRSYQDFVNRMKSGTPIRLSITRGGNTYSYVWSKSMLLVNDQVVMAFGCPSGSTEVMERLHAENAKGITVEDMPEFTLYIDSGFLTSDIHVAILKVLRESFLTPYVDAVDSGYVVIKDLENKMFTPVEILPKFKRPAERIAYIENLIELLVDSEDVVEDLEPVDTKVVITVEPPKEEEWTPEGWEE